MDDVFKREEEMVWLVVVGAWMIWAHLGADALKGTGIVGAMLIAGFAMHQFLDNYWKLETEETVNGSSRPSGRREPSWGFSRTRNSDSKGDGLGPATSSWEARLLKTARIRGKALPSVERS